MEPADSHLAGWTPRLRPGQAESTKPLFLDVPWKVDSVHAQSGAWDPPVRCRSNGRHDPSSVRPATTRLGACASPGDGFGDASGAGNMRDGAGGRTRLYAGRFVTKAVVVFADRFVELGEQSFLGSDRLGF